MHKKAIRVGGIAAVMGGIQLLLLAFFQMFYGGNFENYPLVSITLPFLPLFLLVGIVGVFLLTNGRRWVQAGIIVTAVGAVLLGVGFGLMEWLNNDNGWIVSIYGLVNLPVGLLVLGAANWRAQILPRWNNLPLMVGVPATLLIVVALTDLLTEQQNGLLFTLYLLLLAVGWIGFGVAMMRGKRETDTPKAAAYP